MLSFFSSFFKSKNQPTASILTILAPFDLQAFGSQVWGGATTKSDFDFICTYDNYSDIEYALEAANIPYKIDASYGILFDAVSAINIRTKESDIQIFFMRASYYNRLLPAVGMTTAYFSSESSASKAQRIHVFNDISKYVLYNHKLPGYIHSTITQTHPELLI